MFNRLVGALLVVVGVTLSGGNIDVERFRSLTGG